MDEIVVFLGPSLPRDAARAVLPARYLPPAARGDVDRARAEGARQIVLIDGVFHRRPSVWHREILSALSAGASVHGAASMGALRAAELHGLGMLGHGTIFHLYREGVLRGDDEVALLHAGEEQGFSPMSVPLVDIRATLIAAVERGCLTAAQARALMVYAKSLYYPERSWERLLAWSASLGWPPEARAALEDVVHGQRVELKREDALGVLRACKEHGCPAPPPAAALWVDSAPPGGPPRVDVGRAPRLAPTAETLARIEPLLPALGVTRCADVTGLDRIGIPVYCAIRPRGRLLQVTNGKGLTHEDARASALMEAIEIEHAERGRLPVRRASARELRAEGKSVVEPSDLWGYLGGAAEGPLEWTAARDLGRGAEAWVPVSAVIAAETPGPCGFSTNGLASGNHLVEATLHALHEVIERDAVARLVSPLTGRLSFADARPIDLDTVGDEAVGWLRELVRRAGIRLVLVLLSGRVPGVHTFLAALLDPEPLGMPVNVGYGAHGAPQVAATRAITEAAQSRLTFIHGARQGLHAEAYAHDHPAHRRVYRFFEGLREAHDFRTIADGTAGDLEADCHRVVEGLVRTGHERVLAADLTDPEVGIPVVKVLVPGLRFHPGLF